MTKKEIKVVRITSAYEDNRAEIHIDKKNVDSLYSEDFINTLSDEEIISIWKKKTKQERLVQFIESFVEERDKFLDFWKDELTEMGFDCYDDRDKLWDMDYEDLIKLIVR